MTDFPSPTDRGDNCPGTVRVHPAADGGLARLRFPGGRLRPTDWAALAQIATDHGGDLHLTSRGNIQVRGVRDEALLRDRVEAAGLLPSVAHDRVRNILASPMAGRLAGHHDLGQLPEFLDAALMARDDVAALSGRFLFGFDDGSGDVLAHSPDLAAVAGVDASADGSGAGVVRLHVRGRDTGLRTTMADVATVLVDVAASFVSSTERQWRVPASGQLHDLVVVALRDHPLTTGSTAATGTSESPGTHAMTVGGEPSTAAEVPPVGWVDTDDGLVSLLAVVPFGVVPARLAEFLGAIERPSTISAERVIGLHELTEGMAEQVVRVLAPMGMIFDAASPWVEVTACTGLPGCSRSLTDVRADATAAVREGTLPVVGRQHWVGCDRACGDTGAGQRVTATPQGYVVGRP
ncbi:precorrin-3B synthase [Dietzia sp. NCCP-2495]|uniref:precorrin-3B synthase n=1 Tax=Dietzia sp. NCCP-2495 TaxID=2934675 RepID=UPI00222F556D|nr:precorrin-3B synthase [Dietzia sp. NCCP-2495]GLB62143.1 precorrin-3B synthase [Dietzia sp. NCCP-2495]